ncbi:MAG: hypothetical protein IPM37_20555 [Hahellaceae bacterium]|nr:hypothetical protein [Hahellaceae bacterium]
MENLDTIVVILGIVLILAGVALFVTGKVVSQNNQIEAFGIKLNFNNPSFLLVVAGIGMVLVPRLLPDPARLAQLPPPAAGIPGDQQVPQESTPPIQPPPSQPTAITTKDPIPKHPERVARLDSDLIPGGQLPSKANVVKQAVKGPPSIAGSFDLFSYSINNVPQTVDGNLHMKKIGDDQYEWVSHVEAFDYYGNYLTYMYTGFLSYRDRNWYLKVTSSNDPTWIDNGVVPTQVNRQGDRLQMTYTYSGAHISAVWEGGDGSD